MSVNEGDIDKKGACLICQMCVSTASHPQRRCGGCVQQPLGSRVSQGHAVQGYFMGAWMYLGIVFTLPLGLGVYALALDLPVSTDEALQGLVMPASAYVLLGKGGDHPLMCVCLACAVSKLSRCATVMNCAHALRAQHKAANNRRSAIDYQQRYCCPGHCNSELCVWAACCNLPDQNWIQNFRRQQLVDCTHADV